MDYVDMVYAIIDWYENPERPASEFFDPEFEFFDPEFVYNMAEKIEEGKDLFEAQELAIESIYNRWVDQ